MDVKMLHVCLRVGNLDASIKFYQDVLGLVETRRNDKTEHGFILVYLSDKVGGYELELTYNIGTDSYIVGDGFSHIAIGVDDLEASHENHSKLEYEVTPLKGLPGNQPNYYFITDPDGYKVEVIRNK
jgi:lactoylglutathione lyase